VENSGALDVVILPQTPSTWIEFVGTTKSIVEDGKGYSIPAGESFTIDYQIHVDKMASGTSSSIISVNVVDDMYPDCFYDSDLTFNVSVQVMDANKDNHIGKMAAFGWALSATVIVASCAFAVWTLVNRKMGVVRASQPLFLVLICIGTGIMGSAMIPLGFDDGNASEAGADAACMAVPWLVSTGFTISFAALVSKIWRLNQLFSAARSCTRLKVTEKDVMKPL